MKLYVTYNYMRNGDAKWGSMILHNLDVQFPLTERNITLICEKIAEFDRYDVSFWEVNLVYMMPLSEEITGRKTILT